MEPNLLYYGDNLDVLRRHVKDESIDLIYLDPPFKSNQDYNVLFAEQDGSRAAVQIKAFEDTWRWDQAAAHDYETMVEEGGKVSLALQAFRTMLGPSDMLAYLSMMAPRLKQLRRVLAPAGAIFLHCDPTASHYLKMLMDAVFGTANFRNEIVWCYTGPSSPGQRQFSRKHDTILFYARGSKWTFNADAVRVPYNPKTEANYKSGLVGSGFVGADHLIHKLGKIPEDWWQFAIAPRGKEYLHYPTQKPEKLLDRIIRAGSDEGQVVLDPFCGCGTAVAVAQRLNRRWIGIDITNLAITLIRHRLYDQYGEAIKSAYRVIGEPVSVDDAAALAAEDPYQFQWWALGLVGARPVEQKKGADQGIDGSLFFHDEPAGGQTKQVIISVKAGHTNAAHVRDLRGVVEREGAAIGVLVSLQVPTQPMRTEAASAGFYHSPGWNRDYPRVQLLTVAELLAGKGIAYPPGERLTFKRAPKTEARDETGPLFE